MNRCPGAATRSCPLTARRAFTLVEVIVSIALTAIVTTIASVAIGAASDARDAVLRNQSTVDFESRWRVMLSDMLRHAPSVDAVDEPLLRIDRATDGSPRLVFLSRGVVQPFGTGRIWRVTVHADGADGVTLDAQAIGRGPALVPLHSSLPHLAALEIAVLDAPASGVSQWRADWPVERSRPTLVRLGFTNSVGSSRARLPLVVGLAPVALPAQGIAP